MSNTPTEMVRHLPKNVAGRDFLVGDLHGCYDDLMSAMNEAGFDRTRDRLISVGDLIDRGPDSRKCVALLDESWFFAIRGNHEQMMIDAVLHQDDASAASWMKHGGLWATALSENERRRCAEQLDTLPHALVVGTGADRYNVIHAEFFGRDIDLDLAAKQGFDEVQLDSLLWGCEIARKGAFEPDLEQYGLSTTYCGHTVVEAPFRRGSHVFLDTGAYIPHWKPGLSGRLTLLEHGSDRTLCYSPQAKARSASVESAPSLG